MTANGKLKSEQLRDELIRIDAGIVACKQDESEAHALIRSLARAAIAPDAGDALQQIKKAEGKLGSAKMTHRRLYDARAEVEGELGLALAQEDQERRETDAKAAEVFAEGLPNLFSGFAIGIAVADECVPRHVSRSLRTRSKMRT